MAKIKFGGSEVNTSGSLPSVGSAAPSFTLVKSDLSDISLKDLKGKYVILNIFPSLDTSVCAASVRKFNKDVTTLPNTVVLAISADLPFAAGRFCTAEGIENVIPASVFRNPEFAKDYGVLQMDGPLKGLLARAVIVVDPEGKIKYTELVPEIKQEPNYQATINSIV
ncbi:thiol peroxidase [Dysgonomonas sp. 520]|uniref:thiol peroxidase n=1 Tax=Dysgonomonas sp. 520 TaxID=2302931 RepID=UPI0013D4FB6B|nr:thiol peroxidase [Dysgonomonas sp. 520]NDW09134.1 thiol peroxidase [Dysgonomonas sp. 520]